MSDCDGCGRPISGRRPVSGLCYECFCESKGVLGVCELCGQRLSRKRIAGLQSNRSRRLYCSRECSKSALSGDQHPAWKGGEIVNGGGYVMVRRDGAYTQKHRAVIESHLGRKLHKWETVHHKNGDRKDNRLENLELMGSRHPKGQFFGDFVFEMMDRIHAANPRCLVTIVPRNWPDVASTEQIEVFNIDSGSTTFVPLA